MANASLSNETTLDERMSAMEDTLEQYRFFLDNMQNDLEVFFLITMGDMVLIMQGGFAFLESGVVRSKNTTNILIKNFLDMFISGIAFWLFGYAFAFGEGNSFIGYSNFAGQDLAMPIYAKWFYQYVFASTASTIISGAVAERCDFKAYITYSFFISGVVYPIVAHWVWQEGGWLKVGDGVHGFRDFAGGGAVHMFGGACALVGAIILGPRIGRFDRNGKPILINGHSLPLSALGGFIIVFGFIAFNAGSQGHITWSRDGDVIANIVANTVISGSFACITSLIVCKLGIFDTPKHWSFIVCLNGTICGMVAICPGGDRVFSWGAAIIGTGSGTFFLAVRKLILCLKIDDPLDAFSVHFTGGCWGLISSPFLVQDTGLVFGYGDWKWLAWNAIGVVAIAGWAAACCTIMFGLLRCFHLFRVSEEMERMGLDALKHEEAYVDDWIDEVTTAPAYPATDLPNEGNATTLERNNENLDHQNNYARNISIAVSEHDRENGLNSITRPKNNRLSIF